MFYGKATDQATQEQGECGGAVTAILTAALEQNLVDGALVIKRSESIYDGFPFFATTKEEIAEASGSLHCAPTLSAKVIKNYLNAARDTRVASHANRATPVLLLRWANVTKLTWTTSIWSG